MLKPCKFMVGATGFEPATPSPPDRINRLKYPYYSGFSTKLVNPFRAFLDRIGCLLAQYCHNLATVKHLIKSHPLFPIFQSVVRRVNVKPAMGGQLVMCFLSNLTGETYVRFEN